MKTKFICVHLSIHKKRHPKSEHNDIEYYIHTLPKHAGADHQWTIPTSRGTFKAILASESHWLQPMLVLSVHSWPPLAGVGRVLDYTK